MTYATTPINPFYAASLRRVAPARRDEAPRAVYARLPRAPITGCPVPHLTIALSLPPRRGIRRPEMARQLRRQPDQGLAELFQAGNVLRPDERLGHVP